MRTPGVYSLLLKRQSESHQAASTGPGIDYEFGSNQHSSFAHAKQTQTALRVMLNSRYLLRLEALPVVLDTQKQSIWQVLEFYLDPCRLGMPPDVGECLLGDAKDSNLGLRRQGSHGARADKARRDAPTVGAIAEPFQRRPQAQIVENRGPQVPAGPAHLVQGMIGQGLQAGQPVPILLQIGRAHV